MFNRLTDSLDFQSQALNLRSERQRLIASNIANADTPGYLARDLNFADALRSATGSMIGGAAGRPTLALAATRPGHVGADAASASSPASAAGTLAYALASQTNLDRNTVDMDRERASFADNTIKYEAALRFVGGNVKTTLSAISGQP